jgi:hypothetical protein
MELRHLRYFAAVVQWKGYREASRHLYIAQPSISEAVSDLENERGIKLFSREGRMARLTPEGQMFYEEAIKTLAQAERSIATAQGAAKGQIGRLGIGFISRKRPSRWWKQLVTRAPIRCNQRQHRREVHRHHIPTCGSCRGNTTCLKQPVIIVAGRAGDEHVLRRDLRPGGQQPWQKPKNTACQPERLCRFSSLRSRGREGAVFATDC